MSSNELIDLYSGRILTLAANIPHCERLAPPCHSGKARSPLCGSVVTVYLRIEDGKIAAFGQDVKACALGQAAASAIGAVILGQTRASVARGRDELAAMLAGGAVPGAPWQGLEALRAAVGFPNRHASILLCFDAILDAWDEAAD